MVGRCRSDLPVSNQEKPCHSLKPETAPIVKVLEGGGVGEEPLLQKGPSPTKNIKKITLPGSAPRRTPHAADFSKCR